MFNHLNELVLLQAGDAEWTTVRVGASHQSNQADSEVANHSSPFNLWSTEFIVYTSKGSF